MAEQTRLTKEELKKIILLQKVRKLQAVKRIRQPAMMIKSKPVAKVMLEKKSSYSQGMLHSVNECLVASNQEVQI
jgi:hypothetical protein